VPLASPSPAPMKSVKTKTKTKTIFVMCSRQPTGTFRPVMWWMEVVMVMVTP